jgi:hypothetical protein
VAMFDNIFEMLHTAGGYLGAGGGLVAGELYRRFNDARKDAKKAHDIAKETAGALKEALKDFATREWVVQEIQRVLRGSLSGGSDPLVEYKLNELARRMSAIEDQFDEDRKENREWADKLLSGISRLEGVVQQQQQQGGSRRNG